MVYEEVQSQGSRRESKKEKHVQCGALWNCNEGGVGWLGHVECLQRDWRQELIADIWSFL